MNSEFGEFIRYYLNDEMLARGKNPQTEPAGAVLQNGLALTLRAEREEERREVENLTRRAFWQRENMEHLGGIGCNEHYICRVLRGAPEFVSGLDLVAECELGGERLIVGNVMFTAGYVKPAAGGFLPALIFGPLSVLPEFQRMGVGGAIMRRAVELAGAAGWGAIFLYGHPEYYPKLGFVEAAKFGVATHDGENFPAFMAMELIPGFLRGAAGGTFHYTPVFDIEPNAARDFDAAFPPVADEPEAKPLKPFHLPFIHRLMNRPEVLAALHEHATDYAVWESVYNIWKAEGEVNFVIYTDEKPAGWLKLNGFEGDRGWISALAIDPLYMRRGLGAFAVGFAERYFAGRGLRRAAIHTNEDNAPARACYEKCGYKITERGKCTNADGAHRIGLTYEKEL